MAGPVFYLRTVRERRGYTQVFLARRSGIPQDRISKLETKPPLRPGFETVTALAEALGVDARRLRFGPDPTPIRRRRSKPVPDDEVSA
jgi:transcriptional regulator with XRE-family HTH domain